MVLAMFALDYCSDQQTCYPRFVPMQKVENLNYPRVRFLTFLRKMWQNMELLFHNKLGKNKLGKKILWTSMYHVFPSI